MRIFMKGCWPLAIGLALSLNFLLVACGSSSDDGGSAEEGPGADDEPLPEDARFNTAIGFNVVREPGPRLPEEEEAEREYTDADFNLGLPAVELGDVPEGIDTSINRPPFIAGLSNLVVEAGQLVEVLYKPEDPEGGLPGMFPAKLPQGGSFDDNFNGSKTFRWQPLQMDVGITRFAVTVLDPENSLYRATYPILIKVVMPDDPSQIPNVAPMLDTVLSYTARAGDPVVFELKGIDLNGSVPTLEVPELPAGASFEQHPRFEEVYVLKFVPQAAGDFTIDVLVRDSVDSSLTKTEALALSVLDPSAFVREGQPLKVLAAQRNLQVGFAALESFYHRPDGAIYADTAATEFNIVTPENSMKMVNINPEPGRYQFASTDNLIAFAKANDIAVHGHPLVWHQQLPAWVENSEVSEREQHMLDFISRIMTRYNNDITIWDVVNEPIADAGGLRDSVWLEAMGESYIDVALQQARLMSPTATLLINEYDIAAAGPKFDSLMTLVDDLQSREVPLDGIGFQLHVFTSYDQFEALRDNFAAVAERNLDIYITELDVALDVSATPEIQAEVYRQIAEICVAQARCKALQSWGITDQYSFRTADDPLLFDRAYQAKPAYWALHDVLSGND